MTYLNVSWHSYAGIEEYNDKPVGMAGSKAEI
jgi:hypothetical protein